MSAAVESVVCQKMDPNWYEVLIIDNNSQDETPQVSRQFCEKYPNVRYIRETKQGHSHARNRAIEESRGSWVVYLDDDGKAPDIWLETAREIIDTRAPGMFGGSFFPYYTSPKPRWFKDRYAANDIGGEARVLEPQRSLTGGNFFVRKDVLVRLNGFRPELGMCGDQVGLGDEDDVQFRMSRDMPTEVRYYDPRLNILHWVRPSKMTLRFTIEGSFISGKSAYRARLSQTGDYPWFRQLSRQLIKATLGLALFCIQRPLPIRYRRYEYFGNYVFENARSIVTTLGILAEKWGWCPDPKTSRDAHLKP